VDSALASLLSNKNNEKQKEMKTSIKLMLTASLLSVGFASSASAASADVYLTGSSAYRAAVTNAIGHLLNSPQAGFFGTAATATAPATTVGGSNEQLIKGTLINAAGSFPAGTMVYFHTVWTGSLSGLVVLTKGVPAASDYLPDTAATSAMTVGAGTSSSAGPSGGTLITDSGQLTVSFGADGALSDVFQSSTAYASPALVAANGSVLGVVPFVLVGNPDLAAYVGPTSGLKISNVNSTQLTQLFVAPVDLAQLTGNDSDQGTVLPVGRDADSGTRFTTFAETGFNQVGGAVLEPQQYQATQSGTSIDVSLYPAETLFPGTVAATAFSVGQGGYSSGGKLATALSISGTSGANSDNPSYLIGYAGESDATTVVNAGGKFLSFNGVVYGTTTGGAVSFNRTLIDEGEYTLWGYEHLYYKSGNANASILTALASQVRTKDAAVTGELISNMAVQRGYEGGPIAYVGVGNSTE
jgi:hypothetical protein